MVCPHRFGNAVADRIGVQVDDGSSRGRQVLGRCVHEVAVDEHRSARREGQRLDAVLLDQPRNRRAVDVGHRVTAGIAVWANLVDGAVMV
jgi:hypothetical protein